MNSPPLTLKIFGLLLLAIAGLSPGLQAIPTPISGTISFSGTTSIDGTSFLTATRFTAFESVFVGAPGALSGDYLGTSGAAVTMTPFIWSPPTASTPINPLWSFVSGGTTYSFDLSVLHADFASHTGLVLSGLGTAHITGQGVDLLDTPGFWNFSAQTSGGSTFTFSTTTTTRDSEVVTVPDNGLTVAMLGASLLGLALMGRKLVL